MGARRKFDVTEKKVLDALKKKEGFTAPEVADLVGYGTAYGEGKVRQLLNAMLKGKTVTAKPRKLDGETGRPPMEFFRA